MDRETFFSEITETLGRIDAAMDALSAKLTGKVDIKDGKGLSSNDFNDEYLQKLRDLLNLSGRRVNLRGDESALFNEDRLTTIELEV